jgi:methylmalonyl-CoA/ethylmalonyl-CoA epimerase
MLENNKQFLEIICPASDDSIVRNLTKKFNNKIYHICYEVDNIEQAIKDLEEKGFVLIDPPRPAIFFDNRRVAFLSSIYCGIVELIEKTL